MLTIQLNYRSCAVLHHTIGIDKRELPGGQGHDSFHRGDAFCTCGYCVWSSGERETVTAATWTKLLGDQKGQLDGDKGFATQAALQSLCLPCAWEGACGLYPLRYHANI